ELPEDAWRAATGAAEQEGCGQLGERLNESSVTRHPLGYSAILRTRAPVSRVLGERERTVLAHGHPHAGRRWRRRGRCRVWPASIDDRGIGHRAVRRLGHRGPRAHPHCRRHQPARQKESERHRRIPLLLRTVSHSDANGTEKCASGRRSVSAAARRRHPTRRHGATTRESQGDGAGTWRSNTPRRS
ncbi:MAG: hypothetical protein QOJ95_2701, partial [Mycobacterium sp.]|nr:hypothetical protein [Mycobacterium sp.]